MEERNYFEMLGVEFDPPDNIKKIKAAFEEWKKRLTTEQNTTVDAQRLNEIKEELAMSTYIATMIDNPRLRESQASKLKNKRVEQLRNYISLLRDDSGYTLQVTRAQMKKVSDKLHLSLSTVESTYKQEGFEIKKPRNKTSIVKVLNEFFMSDTVMIELYKNFEDFHTYTDFKRYPWAQSVNNLYDLAVKIDKSAYNPSSYRYLSAEELSEIFRAEAQEIAEPIPAWRSIKAILNIAQMQIFDSNENRYRYDHSLAIEPLNNFLADLKGAPEIFKREYYFADNCIKKIKEKLPAVANVDELAASLYNKFAGLLNDPYESPVNPAETAFYVVCGNCQTSTQFRTREEISMAKCPTCGESFYIDCPNCHRKIPSSSEHCSHCGFSLTITCSNCHTKMHLHSHDSLKDLRCPSCGEKFYIECPNCKQKIPSASEKCPHCNFSIVDMKTEMQKFSKNISEVNKILTQLENTKITGDKLSEINLLMNHINKLLAESHMLRPDDAALKALEIRNEKFKKSQERAKLEIWAESKLLSLTNSQEKMVSNCIEVLREMQKIGIKNYRPALNRLNHCSHKGTKITQKSRKFHNQQNFCQCQIVSP